MSKLDHLGGVRAKWHEGAIVGQMARIGFSWPCVERVKVARRGCVGYSDGQTDETTRTGHF